MKNVSKGRNTIMLRLNNKEIAAQIMAATRAQGRNWNSPTPIRIPTAIRLEGNSATDRNNVGWA